MEKNEKIGLARELIDRLYQIAREYAERCRQQEQALAEKEQEISALREEVARLQSSEALRKTFDELAARKDAELAAQTQLIDRYLKSIMKDVDRLDESNQQHSGAQESLLELSRRQAEMQEDFRQRQEKVLEQITLLSNVLPLFRKGMQERPANGKPADLPAGETQSEDAVEGGRDAEGKTAPADLPAGETETADCMENSRAAEGELFGSETDGAALDSLPTAPLLGGAKLCKEPAAGASDFAGDTHEKSGTPGKTLSDLNPD